MKRRPRPFAMGNDEGETIPGAWGESVTVKARAELTGGTFSALEVVLTPGQGSPLHLHVREDQMLYVLAGELQLQAEDGVFEARQGSFAFIPRGTPHQLLNVGDTDATVLEMYTPAGMEQFFEGVAEVRPSPPDADAIRAVARTHWTEVLG